MEFNRQHIIKLLDETCFFLEVAGENAFRVRAYERARRALAELDGDLESLVTSGEISKISGIGQGMAEKLKTFRTTGNFSFLDELRSRFPPTLIELTQIPGLGPKKIKLLFEHSNITSIEDLESACDDGRLSTIPGFGDKMAQKISVAVLRFRKYQSFALYPEALDIARGVIDRVRQIPHASRAKLAGELRRGVNYTDNIEIVVACEDVIALRDSLLESSVADELTAPDPSRVLGKIGNRLRVTFRLAPNAKFWETFHYATGSEGHYSKLQVRAAEKGVGTGEDGIIQFAFSGNNEDLDHQAAEEQIYAELGLPLIPPMLREDRGEVEYAIEHGAFPEFVQLKDYNGVLHCHTVASDGDSTIEQLVSEAQSRGHAYLGITDHSKSSVQANGLSEDRLRDQTRRIKSLQSKLGPKFQIFSGVECDILPDGRLDYPDAVLEQLDFVIASVHSSFGQPKSVMTKRLVRAIEHPCTRILAHPSGRLMLKRDAYEIDLHVILDAAQRNDVAIELNCSPKRMDLDWRYWQEAKSQGIRCSLNPDVHRMSHFDYLSAGVESCRKGWLEGIDIINCWDTVKLRQFLGRC